MSGSVPECRPIPGERGYEASIDGEILAPERRVIVGGYRRRIGGKQYPARRYLKWLEPRTIRPYRGRVRLRQPDGTVRKVSAWKLIAAAFICRIRKTDRCEFIDGNQNNCKAANLLIVRASGKRVTLAKTGGAA